MSSLALQRPDGTITAGEDIAGPVRKRLKDARQWRRQFELGWMMSMGLAAGKHWMTADRNTRTLRRVQDIDPRYKNRELYVADMVTEYRTTMLGELGSDNDLPQLLLRRDDQASEEYEGQANRAIAYGWESEWRGDDILAEVDRLIVDLGTCAVRCRYDNALGPDRPEGELPHLNGKPLLSKDEALQAMSGGPNPNVQMQTVKQGKIVWEPLSPFNLIVPPGITHESLFPWECVMRPVLLTTVQQLYPSTTQGMREDSDIGTILGTDARTPVGDANSWATRDGAQGRLRDHVWVFTYYEKPSSLYANGRVIVFGGNEMRLLSVEDQNGLPYRTPSGEPDSGLVYFHWWRVTGRFWSRSLVDAMKDGQRLIDKRRSQQNEMIDRSMSRTYVQKGSRALDASGVPGEYIELERGEMTPLISSGPPPGPWMKEDVEAVREDLVHATGIQNLRVGENPPNVNTYSALALLNESEQVKRDQIHRERKQGIGKLIEDSLYDIRRYWGPQKEVALAGDDERLEAEVFDATKLPDFFVVRVATGAAKPRTQAAKIQMVQDIWNAIVASMKPVMPEYLDWYHRSLNAGEPLDLPVPPGDAQAEKAKMENHYMLAGTQATVSYWDIAPVHIPIHREAEDEALMSGNVVAANMIEEHVKEHMQVTAANAAQVQQLQVPGAAPAGPPGPTQPPAGPAPPGAPPGP